MQVSKVLRHGAENALSVDTLAALLQTTPRGLRSQIMRERDEGELILYRPGGRGGYFLPSLDPEQAKAEMLAFYNVQAARCKHGLAAIAPVRRALGIPAGQLDFESEAIE